MKKTIVVIGGAGYIGSHASLYLVQQGYNVVVLDSFVHNQFFDPSWATVIKADVTQEDILKKIFITYPVEAVMYFAASIEVGESVTNPLAFYENNVIKTLRCLEIMMQHNVKQFIFSSSCAVYGIPAQVPITEDCPTKPISPYGKTKLIIEECLKDFDKSYGLKSVSLRYFNAAGCLPGFDLGEQHEPETHLIPLLFEALQYNKLFKIFGNDYSTADGTCIRDYLHVWDIAQAHFLALDFLQQHRQSDVFNIGTGIGFSVQEIMNACERITHKKIQYIYEKRREGDPAVLVADATKIKQVLRWEPHQSSLDDILKSAYDFYRFREAAKTIEQNKKSTFCFK